MMKHGSLSITLMAVMLLGTSHVSQAKTAEQAEQKQAVAATIDKLFNAIGEKDPQALTALFSQGEDAIFYAVLGDGQVIHETLAEYNANLVKATKQYREHAWTPTIEVRGKIASYWAPYEFLVDGNTTHCGIDNFLLVKTDNGWQITAANFTVEPDACSELNRP